MVASTHPYDGRRNVVQGQTGNVTSSPRLGGLVVKAGIVNLVGDDRTLIYGALLWMTDNLQGDQGEHARALWTAKGKQAFEAVWKGGAPSVLQEQNDQV